MPTRITAPAIPCFNGRPHGWSVLAVTDLVAVVKAGAEVGFRSRRPTNSFIRSRQINFYGSRPSPRIYRIWGSILFHYRGRLSRIWPHGDWRLSRQSVGPIITVMIHMKVLSFLRSIRRWRSSTAYGWQLRHFGCWGHPLEVIEAGTSESIGKKFFFVKYLMKMFLFVKSHKKIFIKIRENICCTLPWIFKLTRRWHRGWPGLIRI